MYLVFPLIGVAAAWVGLELTGPPISYGHWNLLSMACWVMLVGFSIRLVAAFFGASPRDDGERDGRH